MQSKPEGAVEGPDSVTSSSDVPISTRVALRLAETTETPVDELQPLAESIDPEALNVLFATDEESSQLTFRHAGCWISVTGSGSVTVTRIAEDRPLDG